MAPMYDLFFTLKGTTLSPNLIDRWTLAADGLSWDYYVHPNVKFHNGDDATAEDVAFSLEQYSTKDAQTSELKNSFDHAQVLDRYALRVFTKGVQLDFPAYSGEIAPSRGLTLPKNYIQKNGVAYFQQHPVGSGPFKYVRRVPGDSIEYEANTSYWKPVPAFKTLNVLLIPEEATRVAMLKTQALDITEIGMESARSLPSPDYRTFVAQIMAPLVIFTGTYEPSAAKMPVADVRVRQALSLAINRDEIIKSMFYGQAEMPMLANVSEISRYVDVPKWKEYAAKVTNVYDPVKAQQLLKDAGWGSGFSIDLWTFPQQGAGYLPNLAEVLQGYWGKLGVKAKIIMSDQATAQRYFRAWPISPQMIGQAVTSRTDVGPFTNKNLSTYFGSPTLYPNFTNLLGNSAPEMDKLLVAANDERDPEKKKALYSRVLQAAADTYLVLMIVHAPGIAVMGPRVDADYNKPQAITLAYVVGIARHR